MIKFLGPYFYHQDSRGTLKGLINFGSWEEVNLIESESGIVRGNHYHLNTFEVFIILEGKIKIRLERVINNRLSGEIQEYIVKAGDVFLIEKEVNHSFEVLEKSKWINILSSKMTEHNKDIHRIER